MAPRDRLNQALDVTDSRGLSGLMVGLLGGTFMTVAYTFWGAIESIGTTFLKPIRALVDSLATLITMVAVMLGIYVFARFWERIDLSPWGWLGDLRR
jgi:hypothetical protein